MVFNCHTHSEIQLFSKSYLRGWFKGADTAAVCRWLQHKFDQVAVPQSGSSQLRNYTRAILTALSAGNSFLRELYNANLFLGKLQSEMIAAHGRGLIDGYCKAANLSYAMGKTRFKLVPKLHMLARIVMNMEQGSKTRAWSLSPLAYSCQLDEDLVGRTSAMSRSTDIRSVHTRTLRKYLCSVKFHLHNKEPCKKPRDLRAEPAKPGKRRRPTGPTG